MIEQRGPGSWRVRVRSWNGDRKWVSRKAASEAEARALLDELLIEYPQRRRSPQGSRFIVEDVPPRARPRFSLTPLLRHRTQSELARLVGVNHMSILRRVTAGLDVYEADVYASRLGRHPTEIWPDWAATPTATEAQPS